MLVYLDCSGNPRFTDAGAFSVFAGIAMRERDSSYITRELYKLKVRRLGNEEVELKANKFLKRRVFAHARTWRLIVEPVMQFIKEAPLTVYAVIMPRPTMNLAKRPGHLRPQYRFLAQRIQLHMQEIAPGTQEMAVMIFDEEERRNDESLSRAFRNFRFRSEEGRTCDRLLENCHFANSSVTPGLEIADFCASVLRQAEEHGLHTQHLRGIQDPYLFALKEFTGTIRRKTKNFPNRYGLYRMSPREWEKWNHPPAERAPSETTPGASQEPDTSSSPPSGVQAAEAGNADQED